MFKYRRGLRKSKGAMAAEYVATMYVLFLFIFFPVLNLGSCGLRAFFLWFACNQATMLAAKAKTFNTLVYVPDPGGTPYPGAYDTARARAAQIRGMFPGVNWTTNATNPEVDILLSPIPGSGAGAAAKIVGPTPLGLGNIPDVNQYVSSIRVTINGQVDPLIPVPWFNIQGLTSPMFLTVSSQAEFENPPGLQF
ncbi:MAG: hypothetical protein JST01_05365 [Cyanobacteria bacterium SZAS TMP-1]|nr:hypothetical protein [Cyanobacteria bacterium SZAS TMP-1]